MDLFTLDRNFHKQDLIDVFISVIWTERYYGNNEVELVVEPSGEMFEKLLPGTFLGLDGSDDVMMLESAVSAEGKLKLTGASLLPWLNHRFIRVSNDHTVKEWLINDPVWAGPQPAGWIPWGILWNMGHKDSPFLQPGDTRMGIPHPERLAIPGLSLVDFDRSGPAITGTSISYGPLYDVIANFAANYELGMKLTLTAVTDTSFTLGFLTYKGIDRSSEQSVHPVVRFSPQMDSFTNITELRSIVALETLVYTFASGLGEDSTLKTTPPGSAELTPATGFDLRVIEVLDDGITDEMVGDDSTKLLNLLNTRATEELSLRPYQKHVDGEIVPESQFKYGVHFNMGDIIEVQGNSEIVSKARVTEYIRSQDDSGERAYPTVVMIE